MVVAFEHYPKGAMRYLGVTFEFVVDYKYGYKIYKNYFIIFVNSKKLVFLVFLKLGFLSFLCYEMQKADFEEW